MSDATSKRARTEAAAWFARLSKLSVTTDALREFRDWKQLSDNAAAYAEVEATWNAAGKLRGDPDVQALTQAALDDTRPGRLAARKRARTGRFALAAAGLAGSAAIAAWLVVGSQPAYRTGVGEQRLVVLSDGSRVRLNTDSAIRVRFRGGQRRVDLTRGEAFFDVRHDPRHPFIVQADGARIFDIGTKFDVRRLASDVQVTLVEGQIQVAGNKGRPSAKLAPNQQLLVTDHGPLVPSPIDAGQVSSWTTGRLIFHGVALQDAISEMNRYSTDKIVLDAPPQLVRQPVSGVFDTGDTAALVVAAKTLFALQSTIDPDGSTHLSPRG
jgi:transmembrane sensor